MTNDEALRKLTPGELIALLTRRQSAVDADKGMDDLTVGDLMVMKHNPDLLEAYKRDRRRKLQSESLSEDEISVGELSKVAIREPMRIEHFFSLSLALFFLDIYRAGTNSSTSTIMCVPAKTSHSDL